MNAELSVIDLFLQASLIVKLVIVALLAASVLSWTIILRKRRLVMAAGREADAFEAGFWSGGDLRALHRAIEERGRAILAL